MKRAFSVALGLGAGLLVGAYLVRRMDEATQAVAPANVATLAGRAAGGLVERMREAAEAGREAAAAREAELRATYEVPAVRDVLRG